MPRTPRQARPLLDLIAAFPVVMKVYLRGGTPRVRGRVWVRVRVRVRVKVRVTPP